MMYREKNITPIEYRLNMNTADWLKVKIIGTKFFNTKEGSNDPLTSQTRNPYEQKQKQKQKQAQAKSPPLSS